jgi:hypothetical protein
MNSQQVKQAFAASGVKVRVADQGLKFRICRVGDIAHDKAQTLNIAAALGLTDVMAMPGGHFNQSHEFCGYKPGAIRAI